MGFLSFRDVTLEYRGTGRTLRALDSFDLEVGPGEPVVVIGPSGCGKSTMLLLAAGLLQSTCGTVSVDGDRLSGPRRTTALILQEHGLLPWKTAEANAALGLRIRGAARREAVDRAREALALVGLAAFADAYPGQLSGGMRQRVGLARAVALEADLLLMDEPLSALDALRREDLQNVLLDLWKRQGHAQVLVTHSIEEAVFLGRRIVVMSPSPGRVHAIVDNPGMGSAGYRQEPAFHEQCAAVRAILAEEGAFDARIDGAGNGTGTRGSVEVACS